MRRRLACLLKLLPTLLLLPGLAQAQAGMSQVQVEADCLQRLTPLVPHDVKVKGVNFSALGNYATYYVVSYRFTGNLRNGNSAATCTYRRDGGWVRDDAAAWKLALELGAAKGRENR